MSIFCAVALLSKIKNNGGGAGLGGRRMGRGGGMGGGAV